MDNLTDIAVKDAERVGIKLVAHHSIEARYSDPTQEAQARATIETLIPAEVFAIRCYGSNTTNGSTREHYFRATWKTDAPASA